MITITSFLAAVIGTFVLGLDDLVQNIAPQACFKFDFTNADDGSGTDSTALDTFTITRDSGDAVLTSQLSVTVSRGVDDLDKSTPADGYIQSIRGGNSLKVIADMNNDATDHDNSPTGDVVAGSINTLSTDTTSGSTFGDTGSSGLAPTRKLSESVLRLVMLIQQQLPLSMLSEFVSSAESHSVFMSIPALATINRVSDRCWEWVEGESGTTQSYA